MGKLYLQRAHSALRRQLTQPLVKQKSSCGLPSAATFFGSLSILSKPGFGGIDASIRPKPVHSTYIPKGPVVLEAADDLEGCKDMSQV
jgi:hypothetical protein